MKHSYSSVAEATNDLIKKGYTENLRIISEEKKLVGNDSSVELSPENFKIDAIYRFEGMTNPADSMIVYAISKKNGDKKGVLVNAYGVDSDDFTASIVEKLEPPHKEDE